MLEKVKPYLKATSSAVVCAAAYLVGVIPATGGLGDVTTVQWLGLVVFMGAAYGVTFAVPYKPTVARNQRGSVDVALLLLVAIAIGVTLLLFHVHF